MNTEPVFLSGINSLSYEVLLFLYVCVCVCVCVCAQLCLALCGPMDCSSTPLSMGLTRQEYWSGLPFPTPGESSQPRDWTHISCASCIVPWILYYCTTLRSHILFLCCWIICWSFVKYFWSVFMRDIGLFLLVISCIIMFLCGFDINVMLGQRMSWEVFWKNLYRIDIVSSLSEQ